MEFSDEDLLKALQSDLFLAGRIKDRLAVMDRALMYLHEQKIITLQNGLAVFRQAMTIKLNPEKRRYGLGDYEPLSRHYGEKILQIHVMNEYAKQGLKKITKALRMVAAYFSMERDDFIKRFFPGQETLLARAATKESYTRIVESLHNPRQEAVVCARPDSNLLILAGPGSGKTRVVVHRCAYLLRILRIPARSILMLCFNRSGALSLRKRLRELVGDDALHVAIHTYHGLALRLTGRCLESNKGAGHENPDFDDIIDRAVELLTGTTAVLGMEQDEIREKFLGGLRHILVDEYQDIDGRQYDLISALTGRLLKDPEQKLSILAVGDDDQNIYSFRGASIRFIHSFQYDYKAQIHYLVENYRSSDHIIQTANRLIAPCRERMKREHPIVIDKGRRGLRPGGARDVLDPVGKGKVRIITADNEASQTALVIQRLHEIKESDPDFRWDDCAVLAREWRTLDTVRGLCEAEKIPSSGPLDPETAPPLHRVREFALFLEELCRDKQRLINATRLLNLLAGLQKGINTPWWERLRTLLLLWQEESNDSRTPASAVADFIFEFLREERYTPIPPDHLYLGTIHSTKGLEFKHVLLMDGGWGRTGKDRDDDEDRRLYYVGMTRAKETLTLYRRGDLANPLLSGLSSEHSLNSEPRPSPLLCKLALQKSYIRLGPADIFLSYAGTKPHGHPIHRALSELQTDDRLTMQQRGKDLFLLSGPIAVAALSQKAAACRLDRVAFIDTITVSAIIRRFGDDSDPEYRKLCRVEQWEIPLVEISLRREQTVNI